MSTLTTERLTLKAPSVDDLSAIVPLLNDYDVAKNLTHVAHPYTTELGRSWIAHTQARRRTGDGYDWAVWHGKIFVGSCSIGRQLGHFNLGYWYGRPHWGKGYATEAAASAVRFAFEELGETALVSGYYADNPNSGRVLEKLGFEPAGCELMHCFARNATVVCNRVWLAAEDYLQKKAA